MIPVPMTTLNSTAERCRALPRLGALCLLALPLAAQAWNATGHRLVAEIAWQNLSPAARQQSARLLETHPDIDHWRERAKSDEPRAVFSRVDELKALGLDVPPMAELSRMLMDGGLALPAGILTVDDMVKELTECRSKVRT